MKDPPPLSPLIPFLVARPACRVPLSATERHGGAAGSGCRAWQVQGQHVSSTAGSHGQDPNRHDAAPLGGGQGGGPVQNHHRRRVSVALLLVKELMPLASGSAKPLGKFGQALEAGGKKFPAGESN